MVRGFCLFIFMLLCFCFGFENEIGLVLDLILRGGDIIVMVTKGVNLVRLLVSCWTGHNGLEEMLRCSGGEVM
jgi:hypothetical protein